MRLLFFSVLCAQLVSNTLSILVECNQLTEQCYSTNYYSYVECVRKRHKRSLQSGDCDSNCNTCDCDSCNYNKCQTKCNDCCNTCCTNYIPCSTNHCCHKTCHAQCSTSTCRSSCRQKCFDTVKNKMNIENTHSHSSSDNSNKPNVTTIIHLNNVINNTNIIDVPINLNSTNIQNVTLNQKPANSSSSFGQNCCTVIGPRQCTSDPYPRCFYLQSKQCGPFCTSSIVHKEQQQYCESIYPGAPPNCKQQTTYIPQPQPRCVTQAEWPYVRCGIQKSAACAGCYRHYVDQNSTAHLSCPMQCYDDGFGMGPLYRLGPIYRPTFSHAPCCWYGGYPFNIGYNSPYGGVYGTPYGGDYGSSLSQGGGFISPHENEYPLGYDNSYGGFGYPSGRFGQFPPILKNIGELNHFNSHNLSNLDSTFYSGVNVPDIQLPTSEQLDRIGREIEIKVDYRTPPPAQAHVEIKYDNLNNQTDILDKTKSKKVNNIDKKLKHKLP